MTPSTVAVLALICAPGVALADAEHAAPSPSTDEPRALDVSARGGYGRTGVGGEARIAYRVGPVEALLDIAGARGRWYPRGMPEDDVVTIDARAGARWTPIERGIAALQLTALAGMRRIDGMDPVTAPAFELEARAVIRPRPGLRLSAGLAVPVVITQDGEIDQLDQRLFVGAEVAIADATYLTADVYGGGAYGYDGDGQKLDAGVLVGVRFAELEAPRSNAAAPSAFVASEYRALGVGGHYSHGLGFAVGATVLGGHLRVGLAGWNRPGPMNSKTFRARAVDGEMLDGSSEFALRSDGNFVGAHVAPVIQLGKVKLMLPITVGQAAFGFYLHGDDRAKVQGERVSAVENRLFAGKDSSFAMGIEGGVSASFEIADWISAYGSVHYLATLGYAALDRDSYSGASAALGFALTP